MRAPLVLALALAAAGAVGGTAAAQNAGSTSAATPGEPAAAHATPTQGKTARRTKPPSTAMDVGGATSGVTPTGPNTTTDDAPPVSDLTGSTGASSTMPAGTAPPGLTPPNGSSPDTRGAEAPNSDGGPHR